MSGRRVIKWCWPNRGGRLRESWLRGRENADKEERLGSYSSMELVRGVQLSTLPLSTGITVEAGFTSGVILSCRAPRASTPCAWQIS